MGNNMLRIEHLLFRKEALLKVTMQGKSIQIFLKVGGDELTRDNLDFATVAEAEDAMGIILHQMNKDV